MKRNLLLVTLLIASIGLNAQYWTQQNTNFTGTAIGVNQISIVDSNIVWVNGFNGSGTGPGVKVFSRTNDGGNTWTAGTYGAFGADELLAVLCGVTYDKAFACAYDTTSGQASFWQTTDGGTTWTKVTGIMNNGTTTFADGVKFWNANQGFCYGDPVSNEFDIYTTNDGGTTWNDVPGANIADPQSGEYGYNGFDCVAMLDGGTAFFITNKGRVYKTTDYGTNWSVTIAAPFTSVPSSGKIYASSVNYIIAASYNSSSSTWTWNYTTDGGSTWQAYTPTSGNLYEYAMCYVPGSFNMFVSTSPNVQYAHGVSYSMDGGVNWNDYTDTLLQTPSGTNVQCLAVNFCNMNIGWVGNYNMDTVNNYNSILKYYNPNGGAGVQTYQVNGNDFNIYPNPSNSEVYFSVNGNSNEEIFVKVFDINGNLVFERILNTKGISKASYNFSEFSKGLYIVNISSAKTNLNKKLIIN